MDSYPVPEHGLSGPGPPPPGPSHSPGLQEHHLQQLHQSLQLQQQQLHQQLAGGSSSISELIGMLPQTASINTSSANPSDHGLSHSLPPGPMSIPPNIGNYRPDSGPLPLPAPSPLSFSRHSDSLPSSTSLSLSSYSRHSDTAPLQSLPYSRHTETAPLQTSLTYSRHADTTPLPTSLDFSRHMDSAPSLSYSRRPGQEPTTPGSLPLPSPGLEPGPVQGSASSTSSHGTPLSVPSHPQPQGPPRSDPTLSGNLSIAYSRQGDRFVCSMCGKVVVSKAAITRHIQLTHEKRKPFECNICHRRFGYKNILMEHQNIHFGIKPYACTLCDKRFAARSNLFQHRLLHMKPFCCYICNKRFDRDDQLQRHLKLHPTANVLSCSQCPFTATNVEALNTHLQESHKLLTYDTRRYSTGAEDGVDIHAQVSMALSSPTLTSPDKSPGYQMSGPGGPNMESDASRRIDSICSQLASRGQTNHYGGMEVKQEPLSPGGFRFPPDSHLPPMSPSQREQHFGQGSSPTSTISNNSSVGSSRQQRLPPFSTALARQYSNASDTAEQNSPLPMTTCRKNMSPIPSIDSLTAANKFHGVNPRFLPPSRRANSLGSMNPMGGPLRHVGNPAGPEHVRSIADSTSNLTEFFSTLQGLVQRSQEIPELHINISKPKRREDVGVQHNSTNLPGEPPSLEDMLAYFESQGSIYRCQHCRISFEERGLYFLHKSLHGEMSPWQCSICHKVCADRNDFHLHFVNQQHL